MPRSQHSLNRINQNLPVLSPPDISLSIYFVDSCAIHTQSCRMAWASRHYSPVSGNPDFTVTALIDLALGLNPKPIDADTQTEPSAQTSLRWRHLEGLLDGVVHHLNVGLVDLHGLGSQAAGLIDWDLMQIRAPCPIIFQNQ